MITPEKYYTMPQPMFELAQRVEDYILSDICRRIKQDGYITATAEIQLSALIDRGWSADELLVRIQEITNLSYDLLTELYQQAAEESQRFEKEVFDKLGEKPPSVSENDELQAQIRAQATQTQDTFKNLTGSMGFSVNQNGTQTFLPLAKTYQYILDRAQTEILSGGVSGQQAIKRAIRDLAASGIKTVSYASGRVDQLDVAVRRATVTGMNQIAEAVNNENIDRFESPLVEVSAHGGARDTGSGYQNHKAWQGRVYYWAQKDKWNRQDLKARYPDFESTTGYGRVDGLEGANCRHSKRVFIDGVSERLYTEKQLEKIDDPAFKYEGKEYSTYEATQRQRLLERTQRKYKRILLAYDAAGVQSTDPDYQQAALKLQLLKQEYQKFSDAAGLREQPERAQVEGFSVAQSNRARAAAKRQEKINL